MNMDGVAEAVIEAFRQRGFEPNGKTRAGWFRLHGRLVPFESDSGIRCEVQLDPAFFDLPRIRLMEELPGSPTVIPHVGADGDLCYIARGTVVVDIYDPIGQMLACLERATDVLRQIMSGGMAQDLEEEFFAYWDGWPCFADVEGHNLGKQHCIVAKRNDHPVVFVTDNVERTTRKLMSFGCLTTDQSMLTYRIKTHVQPRPLTTSWPPRTVSDVLAWQGSLDPRCRRKIRQRIREGKNARVNGVLILVESPLLTYGFAVFYKNQNLENVERASRRDPTYALEVLPLSVVRIDDRYIAERNIPKLKTLGGKNIAIVGCGTIGGYLADMLVRAGAGTCGGKLTLIDPDYLLPQNIGRHRLGFPHLMKAKAEALASELKGLMPAVEVRALPVDVRKAHLGQIDLLIDATGEEALGHWLCGEYLNKVPMLSVWIEGPGTAVRALLRTSEAGACYRCLWHSNRRGELRSVSGSLPSVLAGHGCEGLYVPFPASVSVQAASLGVEVALDWINGILSPALRTRVIDPNHQLGTADCDPLPDRECPICSS